MATKRMPWIVFVAVTGITLTAGSAFAQDHAYSFSDELKKGEERAGFATRGPCTGPAHGQSVPGETLGCKVSPGISRSPKSEQ
jgi:hypothetical protein